SNSRPAAPGRERRRLATNMPQPAADAAPCRWRWALWRGALAAACLSLGLWVGVPADAMAAAKETYSIDYIVTISEQHPEIAQVRWELSGIEEIHWLRLQFTADRISQLQGSGKLEPTSDGMTWIPGGPYAHLTYRVNINHMRGQRGRYDS